MQGRLRRVYEIVFGKADNQLPDLLRMLGWKGVGDNKYWRIFRHVAFWAVMYSFFIYLKAPLLGLPLGQAMLVELRDLVVIALIFFFLSYYVVPKLLFRGRIIPLIAALLGMYYFYAISVYLEFTLLPKVLPIEGPGYKAYAARVLEGGFSGIFVFVDAAEILLDLSYLLSPALIIKLIVELVKLNTRALKLEMDNLNLELAFLKSQLNPHFLFNTLNNVYSLALHKSNRAADAVLKLSDLMRYTLYDSNTTNVALSKEVAFFKNYVSLEEMRYSSRVRVGFVTSGDYEGYTIAPLILFPFIENAFKHGIDASIHHAWVQIDITLDNGILFASIKNSKHPPKVNKRPAKPGSVVGGIGIPNAIKRLELLYPDKYKLEFEKDESYYSVRLELKLDKNSLEKKDGVMGY